MAKKNIKPAAVPANSKRRILKVEEEPAEIQQEEIEPEEAGAVNFRNQEITEIIESIFKFQENSDIAESQRHINFSATLLKPTGRETIFLDGKTHYRFRQPEVRGTNLIPY